MTSLVLGVSAVSLRAQFKFDNAGLDGRWSNPANWTGGSGSYPAGVSVGAEMAVSDVFTTTLDVDATVGALRNTAGSARIWTIANDGEFTLTLDHSGGVNFWGNSAAEIRTYSSGGIICAADLLLHNTPLDVGTGGSNNANAQIILSGSITANSDTTITVRNNRRRATFSGAIGASGTGAISLVNLSTSMSSPQDANQLVVSGSLGRKVVRLTQGEGVCAGMIIAGANPDFCGQVSVLANSITVEAGATLGDSNTVVVARQAKLILQGKNALGTRAGLEVDHLGSVTLNYAGIQAIDALSLDGGMSFASPGSIWGASGSGAQFQSAQLQGPGLLQVMPASLASAEGVSW